MFKLIKTVLKTGDQTVKYPFAPLEVAKDFRGKPELIASQCISCGACARACPANAIVIENDIPALVRQWELSIARCIYCGRCEEVCPTRAIRLSESFELAVTNKRDLYEVAKSDIACCLQCEKPFVPQKLLDYTIGLLKQTGMKAEQLEHSREQIKTCPECRRKDNMLDAANVACSAFLPKSESSLSEPKEEVL
ncbi:formate hydrogenlyase complex iron-sulfur subunit [Vibrio variabilis]|uniref:formate hydrogenlyase complex iron-sulfur subunit n=1 Tax=Vibrio variabilis TaxID=990271 RepID=UPI000DD74EE7|nr:formate hydrogenlyase complex iron-sulfur subunit [Vibrio variabilis]